MASKEFLSNNFLLESDEAIHLYTEYAASVPILDYHNHLSPRDIAQNRKFSNLTEAWLDGDHYKWRAMRINGIAEKYCTGDASPEDKFLAWAQTIPYTLRNPLYHWTHLELKRYFGVNKLLNNNNAKDIYDECSTLLQQDSFCVQALLKKMNVEIVCTTDDPIDSLEYHESFALEDTGLSMYPTFRPDRAFLLNDIETYNFYIDQLSNVAQIPINTFDDLIEALNKRMLFFNNLGCRSSDHGIDFLYFDNHALSEAPYIFKKARQRIELSINEKLALRCAILLELCKGYHQLGWVQQFHLGAMRGNNTRMKRMLGADTGFDSIGEYQQAEHLSRFLDSLDKSDQLAKTILYNSNPAHNEVFASMVGNFCDGTIPGKIQYGAGWWFLDQKDGIEKQLNALSNMGLLSRFVGMVTDSRSFLSFPRHEYFRRILCNLIGNDIAHGELPGDFEHIGKVVQGICYFNTKNYFNF